MLPGWLLDIGCLLNSVGSHLSQLRTAPSCLLSSLQNSAARDDSESGEVALLILDWKAFGQSCACFPLLFLSAWLHRVNPDPRRPPRPSVLCKNVGYEFSVNKTNPDHPSPQFSSCEDFRLPLSFHCRRVLKQIQLVISPFLLRLSHMS